MASVPMVLNTSCSLLMTGMRASMMTLKGRYLEWILIKEKNDDTCPDVLRTTEGITGGKRQRTREADEGEGSCPQ